MGGFGTDIIGMLVGGVMNVGFSDWWFWYYALD